MNAVFLIVSLLVAAVIGLSGYAGRQAYAKILGRTRSPVAAGAIRLTAFVLLAAEILLIVLVADWLVFVMFGVDHIWRN